MSVLKLLVMMMIDDFILILITCKYTHF